MHTQFIEYIRAILQRLNQVNMSRKSQGEQTVSGSLRLRHEHLIITTIVAAFVVLAASFSLGPIFEGPDEVLHYNYARVIATTGSLPDASVLPPGQYVQAPLYYILTAPLTLIADSTGTGPVGWNRNNYIYYHSIDNFGNPGNDNKNFYLHTRIEAFPYTEDRTVLAVHLARLGSVVLGALTVLTSYQLFRVVWPTRPDRYLIATGLVAFWPQFIYVSSVLNNDNLIILTATVTLLLLLRQLRDGPSWKNAVLLGIVLGAALLSKVSALYLVFPVALTVLLDLKRSWRYALLTGMVILAVAGWWYVYNTVRYGDPLAMKLSLSLYPHERIPPAGRLDAMLLHVPHAYANVWARFGWLTVGVSEPIYRFFDILTIGSAVGAVLRLLTLIRKWVTHQPEFRQALVVVTFVLGWVAMLATYTYLSWYGAQGRYLLPAIAGWSALFSFGLDAFTPHRLRLPAAFGGIALMFAVASICLFGYFLPAYWPSPLPDHIEHPLSLRYENAAELIGIESDIVHARPGETTHITLYWRAIQPTDANLTAFVHSVGSNVVFRDSFPATGNLLSTDWLPGQTWAERYLVIIPQDAEVQAAYPLMAGLYETDTQRALIATDAEGRGVTPLIGQIVIHGPAQPIDPDYRFGDVIGLAEPKVWQDGGKLKVCLRWVSLEQTSVDYHVFVHVLSADGDLTAQVDVQPRNGQYPTAVWIAGETINDCVTLDTPRITDNWKVAIGLYELPSGQRLPVVNREGHLLDNGMVVVLPPD